MCTCICFLERGKYGTRRRCMCRVTKTQVRLSPPLRPTTMTPSTHGGSQGQVTQRVSMGHLPYLPGWAACHPLASLSRPLGSAERARSQEDKKLALLCSPGTLSCRVGLDNWQAMGPPCLTTGRLVCLHMPRCPVLLSCIGQPQCSSLPYSATQAWAPCSSPAAPPPPSLDGPVCVDDPLKKCNSYAAMKEVWKIETRNWKMKFIARYACHYPMESDFPQQTKATEKWKLVVLLITEINRPRWLLGMSATIEKGLKGGGAAATLLIRVNISHTPLLLKKNKTGARLRGDNEKYDIN